jgi:ABC-type thiamin/hydroxymethylpyrimidine transport system permease subunit
MQKWSLQQVVLLAFLAFLFGGVFMGAGVLYSLLNVSAKKRQCYFRRAVSGVS